MSLRPYQLTAVEQIRQCFAANYRRVLLVAPTGSGKTIIYAHTADRMHQRGKRVLILEHRTELIKQTCEKLTTLNVPHGIISPNYPRNYDALVQVASVQTLINCIGKYPVPDLLIVDEAHHCISTTQWGTISTAYNSLVLGVTATPIRSDNVGLGDVFQTIVHGPNVDELMEQGYLARASYYSFPSSNSIIVGNCVNTYAQVAPHKPAIAFCKSVAHAILVSQQFVDAGFKSTHVSGNMSQQKRNDAINGLSDGSVEVLCSCDVISEGTDIPMVTVGILLRQTQSLALHLQQLGRCLRTAPNKDKAIFLDHVGNIYRHGFAEDKREWTLEGEMISKRKSDKTPAISICGKCFGAFKHDLDVCPYCGMIQIRKTQKFEVNNNIRLVEVSQEEVRERRRQAREAWAAARCWRDLFIVAKQYGLSRQDVFFEGQRRRYPFKKRHSA